MNFEALFPGLDRSQLPREVLASAVVFLVALPLCMGIAIASGVPPALGLVTGIVGGLVVGFFAGSPLQVSGPAAGLAVLVYELVQHHGIEALGLAVLLGGLLQMGAGRLGLGRWFRATAPAVVKGMLSGIGLLILGSQFHVMVDDVPRSGGLANLASIPESIMKGVTIHPETPHHLAAAIGLTTLVTLVAWNLLRPKRYHAIPGPLVAVVVGTTAAMTFALPISYVDVPDNLAASLSLPSLSSLGLLGDASFLGSVLGLAAIASAETLLCATAVDQLHNGERTNYDKELFAQGVGNLLCGLVGALPMTGVIVRSSANVEAGAITRLSAILHGVWLLALVVAMPFVLQAIPTSGLAAILVYTGWKLFDPQGVWKLARVGRAELVIYGVTLAGILAFDLLTGVVMGIVASMVRLLSQLANLHVDVQARDDGVNVDVYLHGAATFVSLPALAEALEALPRGKVIHLHLDDLTIVDHAAFELIATAERGQESAGGSMVVEWDELHALTQTRSVNAAPPVTDKEAASAG